MIDFDSSNNCEISSKMVPLVLVMNSVLRADNWFHFSWVLVSLAVLATVFEAQLLCVEIEFDFL